MAKKQDKVLRRSMQLGETALAFLPHDDGAETVSVAKGFRVSVNGLLVDETLAPTCKQCEKVGLHLRIMERGSQFALGDFILYVEERFGEEASQILDAESGWSKRTMDVYRWLAERIHPDTRRMDRLGVRHHLLVAAMTPAKQHHWLAKAANDDGEQPWTVQALAEAISTDGDAPPEGWWVLVAANSAADQTVLMQSLEGQGRTVKALMKRARKAAKPDTGLEP